MAGMGDLETENELPSCSSSFDAFFFCLSPPSQFKKYYRDGTYADCDHFQKMWETCMTMRYYEMNGKKGAGRWQELRDQMVAMSTKSSKDHVW
eukprot:CAMPEP_0177721684 /NCGR_PEP_ID=MMETSP0484_2-20121128/17279_1 /TAXON_ID=354590 /ORGANISM="Rhodomonas lens, Strain RHODO" /LENGTH=92 /DNA_ID=CAMNT_0019234007 /DNA_START=101 /DNA_END=376 /DNA_ORIENTATION=+